jgi:hypothetical protein
MRHHGMTVDEKLARLAEAAPLARPPLTVELDGYRYHRSRHACELDRCREREARARGDDFRRFTYGDVADPPALLTGLRAVLS